MGTLKALGLDGILPMFSKKYWSDVGESVVEFVRTTFSKREFDCSLNQSLIPLIPKVQPPRRYHTTNTNLSVMCL